MPGYVLHLCDLYCLSQPRPSLSFPMHIAHSITRFPAPSHTSNLLLPFLPPPSRFQYAFLTALSPLWHICCLDTGFERLPFVRLPFWRYCWQRLILYFPKALQSDNFLLFVALVLLIKSHREHVQTTESTQYQSCVRVTWAHLG
jgi:hypothetical protein